MVTRRMFLRSAALAAGLTGAASTATPAGAAQGARQGQGRGQTTGQGPAEAAPKPASQLQVPKMKFGNVEISRVVCGVNPFLGISHINSAFNTIMREYYTPERVCDVMHQCNRFGINAFNYRHNDRGYSDLQRFQAEGGKMHLIVQDWNDPIGVYKAVKPLAMHYLGEYVDRAFQDDDMDSIREWCKKARDTGAMVGLGTHKPEVITWVEEKGWDIDFYAGCVYNRTRTEDEWKQILGGELPESPNEIYLQSDPARMYKVMRQTRKPCFAFKILGAGRVTASPRPQGAPSSATNRLPFPVYLPVGTVEQAFRKAFESIKPNDGVFVGMFPRVKDEVRENAEIVSKILTGA